MPLADVTHEATRLRVEARPLIIRERAQDVASLSRQFRARLQRRERTAVRQVLDAWIDARRAIVADIAALTRAIAATGGGTRGQLVRMTQLEQLLDDVNREILRFGRQADRIIQAARADAIAAAQADTATLINRQLGPGRSQVAIGFRTVDQTAVETIVGSVGQGPVHDLLMTLGTGLTDQVTATLVDGVARGLNPREIGRTLRHITGIPVRRAETIARTETLRAYRESARLAHTTNRDLLTGWQWQATLDRATCPMCIAMHGQMQPTGEVQGTHPNCRCTSLPITKTWAELGHPEIPESRMVLPTGEEWFASLPEQQQRAILGPGRHDAFKAGTPLSAFVGYRNDPKWGPTRFVQPVGAAA